MLFQTNWTPSRLAAVAGVAALLYGCGNDYELRPAVNAQLVAPDSSVATDSAAGVTITAQADSWPGDVNIEAAVTPMRISIVNDSDRLVRLRYQDFSLVKENARRYAALPPYSINASITAPAMLRSYPPFDRLGFRARRFSVAPYYDSVYPMLPAYLRNPWYFDPTYYTYYYPYWDRVELELPTAEMLRRALPEGVLEPQGEVDGFIYFEKVDEDMSQVDVSFNVELIDIVSGEMFASLHIPFVANPASADL